MPTKDRIRLDQVGAKRWRYLLISGGQVLDQGRTWPTPTEAVADAGEDYPDATRATWPEIGGTLWSEPDYAAARGFGG